MRYWIPPLLAAGAFFAVVLARMELDKGAASLDQARAEIYGNAHG